jgi:chromosomal replication initiation ATPase DnaA
VSADQPNPLMWTCIRDAACEVQCITVADFLGRKYKGCVVARWVAWDIGARRSRMTLSELARRTETDHSTVLYGLAALRKRPDLASLIALVESLADRNQAAALREHFTPKPMPAAPPTTWGAIQAAAMLAYGVTAEEFTGTTRHPAVVAARWVAWTLARRLTRMSYPEIAEASGRPSHSAVVEGVQSLARQMRTNTDLARVVATTEALVMRRKEAAA